jgi:nucleotide-binding universal stress UspA family protein
MPPILLATDGSDHARAAAEHAVELARERDEGLHVLCVVDRRVRDEPVLSSYELQIVAAEDAGSDAVTEITQACTDVDVEAEGSVIHGVPAEEIENYAADIGAETIVVGEHGDHSDHLGGVGRELRKTSDREVVVVPLEG